MGEQKKLKKENCPQCQVSNETIEQLKESGFNKREEYISQKEQKERERLDRVRQKKIKKILTFGVPALLILALMGLGGWKYSKTIPIQKEEKPKITVFYSPTCSCCKEYLAYLKVQGFPVEEKETRDMLSVKEKYQIPSEMESCHTAVIGDYFIEGHVPAEAIKKLLEEKPKIDGIALPGMPSGSPGMPGPKKGTLKIHGLSGGQMQDFLEM